jgi:hypothetical protein
MRCQLMEDGTLPLPGSSEARLQGCTCAEHDAEADLHAESRSLDKSCPLHGGMTVFGDATPGDMPPDIT